MAQRHTIFPPFLSPPKPNLPPMPVGGQFPIPGWRPPSSVQNNFHRPMPGRGPLVQSPRMPWSSYSAPSYAGGPPGFPPFGGGVSRGQGRTRTTNNGNGDNGDAPFPWLEQPEILQGRYNEFLAENKFSPNMENFFKSRFGSVLDSFMLSLAREQENLGDGEQSKLTWEKHLQKFPFISKFFQSPQGLDMRGTSRFAPPTRSLFSRR